MTQEAENVRVLTEGYRRWNESKAESADYWLDLLADDVKWSSIAHTAPEVEFSRACESKAQVRDYFEELGKEWEMLHYTIQDFIAQDDKVVAYGHCAWRHRQTGKQVHTPKADIIRMRDGKIVEFYEFFDTAKTIAAAQ